MHNGKKAAVPTFRREWITEFLRPKFNLPSCLKPLCKHLTNTLYGDRENVCHLCCGVSSLEFPSRTHTHARAHTCTHTQAWTRSKDAQRQVLTSQFGANWFCFPIWPDYATLNPLSGLFELSIKLHQSRFQWIPRQSYWPIFTACAVSNNCKTKKSSKKMKERKHIFKKLVFPLWWKFSWFPWRLNLFRLVLKPDYVILIKEWF